MTKFPDVGEAFGAYRLVGELGRGARGVTFEGFDFRLSRQVALKVFPTELTGDAAYRQRFLYEAAVLARLNALHVVQLYDHGESAGHLFLVAQLVPDGDFAAFVESYGSLSPKVAVSVLSQLCEALQDAGNAGVLHRRLEPSNVLVRDRGSVLYAYLDAFGVAATEGVSDVAGAMHSLGGLLWFALTGVSPDDALPQLLEDSEGAVRLNDVLRRAWAPEPADQFAGPVEFADALAALGTLPPTIRIAPPVVVEPGPEPEPPVAPPPVVSAPAVSAPPRPVVEAPAPPPPVETPYVTPEPEPVAPEPEPDPEPEPQPDPEPEPPVTPRPLFVDEVEPAPEPEPEPVPKKSRRARRKDRRGTELEAEAKPAAKPERAPRDRGWMVPGGLLLVLPVLALVGVFMLFNGKGGSNYGRAATTPPQKIAAGETFSFGAFTANAGWKIVTTGPLWQLADLTVINVSPQADEAHFTMKLKKGATVLVALDCRTADLLPAQSQPVSCDDPTSSPYDPSWDTITIEQAF